MRPVSPKMSSNTAPKRLEDKETSLETLPHFSGDVLVPESELYCASVKKMSSSCNSGHSSDHMATNFIKSFLFLVTDYHKIERALNQHWSKKPWMVIDTFF